jgi:hypothetical protein
LALFVSFGGSTVLAGGDMEEKGWKNLLPNPAFVARLAEVNVYVASHHGRDNGLLRSPNGPSRLGLKGSPAPRSRDQSRALSSAAAAKGQANLCAASIENTPIATAEASWSQTNGRR